MVRRDSLAKLTTALLLLAHSSGTPDAPFAWESREFLRKLAIGKRVTFRIDAVSGANGAAPQGGPPRTADMVTAAAATIFFFFW